MFINIFLVNLFFSEIKFFMFVIFGILLYLYFFEELLFVEFLRFLEFLGSRFNIKEIWKKGLVN